MWWFDPLLPAAQLQATQAWSLTVTAASFQVDGQALQFDLAVAVSKADLQPAGQDITLTWTQNWTLPVTASAFDITGQDVTLTWVNNWTLPVTAAAIQPAGQDITLTWVSNWTLAVDAAAFSVSGSEIDLTLTTGQQTYSGGWIESGYQKRYAELNEEIRRELEEEREREELAERLERVLVQEGTLTQAQADLIRLRGLAEQYNRDDLPNRARRSLAFAERAQSEFAAKLALRELKRLDEEEEYAVLLLMALD